MVFTTVAVQELARAPVRKVAVLAGLCRDCLKADECTFPRHPDHPVRSCDEFEGANPPRSAPTPLVIAACVFPLEHKSDKTATDLKGLCAQCARRLTCAYPKPGGGVWHCEELA